MSEEAIQTQCTSCGAQHQAMRSWINQEVICNICNQKFTVQELKNNGTKKCLSCAETILSEAIKCKHCGEIVQQSYTKFTVQDETILRRIYDYENFSSIFWIIIGVIQLFTGFLFIAGIWNIFAGISRRKNLLPKILQKDSTLPADYEPIAGLLIIGIINIILTAGIGIIAFILDLIVRDKVLSNRHLFNDVSLDQNSYNNSSKPLNIGKIVKIAFVSFLGLVVFFIMVGIFAHNYDDTSSNYNTEKSSTKEENSFILNCTRCSGTGKSAEYNEVIEKLELVVCPECNGTGRRY